MTAREGKLAIDRRRLVFVEWEDACGPATGGWQHVSDIPPKNRYRCRSVGWVLQETTTHLSVVPHFGNIHDTEAEQALGVMHIPKAMIRTLRRLRV